MSQIYDSKNQSDAKELIFFMIALCTLLNSQKFNRLTYLNEHVPMLIFDHGK